MQRRPPLDKLNCAQHPPLHGADSAPAFVHDLDLGRADRKEYETRDAAMPLPGSKITAVDQAVTSKMLSFLSSLRRQLRHSRSFMNVVY